jgi:hypothetical protein
MTYDALGAGALNYAPCRYGNSRILFRGPRRRLDEPYVAFVGGTETYGKFIEAPFPALVESQIGVTCANFGIANAGVDVFLNDAALIDAANGAQATVLQVVGANNLSNRFYTVHPRRNDRFISASPVLASIYPEVDFSEFHFTRHMLNILYQVSPERFSVVRSEVQSAWSARMNLLLSRIYGPVCLLWFSDREPGKEHDQTANPADCGDPLFVTGKMLDNLRTRVSCLVNAKPSSEALAAGTQGMVFDEMEALAAKRMMGPKCHMEVAHRLGHILKNLM